MDSKDIERGGSGDGAGGVIASEFPSDLSEGIIPPPSARYMQCSNNGGEK